MASKASAKTLSPAAPAGPKAADSISSAAEPSGNAAQLAVISAVISLRELNKRTAVFGVWTVVVFQAQVQEYEYRWDGKPRTGNNFACLFGFAR